MYKNIEVALPDGTFLEGTFGELDEHGILITDVHRSQGGAALPLAKKVFVPYPSMLFIILEK